MWTFDSTMTILSTIGALILVLALAYFMLKWMGQRMPTQTGSRKIQVLDRVVVGRDKCLLLVRVAEKTILVGMGASVVTEICQVEDPEGLLDSPPPETPHFSEFLRDSLKKARGKTQERQDE